MAISSLRNQRCGLKPELASRRRRAELHFISEKSEMWIETAELAAQDCQPDDFISEKSEMWIET